MQVPTRFVKQCEICGDEIADTRLEGIHQWISGWAMQRDGGGFHGIRQPVERSDRWAHRYCLERRIKGFDKQGVADLRDYPKYIVEFHTDFDNEQMTPQAAAIEAMREVQNGELYADVFDVDSKRQWCIKFRDHVLEVIEAREVEPELSLPGIFPWRGHTA